MGDKSKYKLLTVNYCNNLLSKEMIYSISRTISTKILESSHFDFPLTDTGNNETNVLTELYNRLHQNYKQNIMESATTSQKNKKMSKFCDLTTKPDSDFKKLFKDYYDL